MVGNPFEAPGEDALREMHGQGTPRHDNILRNPGPGAIGRGRNRPPPARDAEDPGEPLQPEMQPAETVPEAGPKALLSNPAWCAPGTLFHEEAEVSVQLSLPEGKRDLTRVEVELHAKTADGSQMVVKSEGHAAPDGKATLKIPVYQPQGYQEGPVDYFLVFKHRLAEALNAETILRKVTDMALKSADHALVPGIAFPVDSSFIPPASAGGLKKLEQKFAAWKSGGSGKTRIVVFGHTDIVERDAKALSERRAQSARAFIANDAGTWEKLYLAEKWGLQALQALLKDQGHYLGRIDGEDGPQTQSAFRKLQKKAGLPESGKEDAATRKALFARYMQGKHDIKLEASDFHEIGGGASWMGCAAANLSVMGDKPSPSNRRVTFILLRESRFFPVHFPCRLGDEKPCRSQCQRKGDRSSAGTKCLFYDQLVREEKQAEAEDPADAGAETVSESQLKTISNAGDNLVKKYQPDLNREMKSKGIDSALAKAHFLAQLCHESGSFRYAEEIASGEAYEGRKDLGNTETGDGKRFKGRGLIQLTGRTNYGEFGAYCEDDFTSGENSKKVAEPKFAVLSAIWYWSSRGLNTHAEKDDFLQVTFRVNGGFNGVTDRAKYLKKGYETFGIADPVRRLEGFHAAIQSNFEKVDPLVEKLIEADKDLDTVAAAKKLYKNGKITLFERMLFAAMDTKAKIAAFKSEIGK